MPAENQISAMNIQEPIAPKVFVSHASEDKQRFVLRFAEALRSKGIDAWVDKWEILPGDSLVDKIFEEGLKNATAVIIVLSKNSVDKPWVREELNASVVQKIANKTKIIPVVIDECEIPAALKSTVWERIRDLEHFQAELDRIVSAIFENRTRPPLGAPPAYLIQPVITIPGLTDLDNLVFKAVCEEVLGRDYPFSSPDEVYGRTDPLQIGREDALDSIEVLENKGHLKSAECSLVREASVISGRPGLDSRFSRKPTLRIMAISFAPLLWRF